MDTGRLRGTTSADDAELVAARRWIAELEIEPAIHRRRAVELFTETEGRCQAVAASRNLSSSARGSGPHGWNTISVTPFDANSSRRSRT